MSLTLPLSPSPSSSSSSSVWCSPSHLPAPSRASFEIHILMPAESAQLSHTNWTLLVVNSERREWPGRRWGAWGKEGKQKGERRGDWRRQWEHPFKSWKHGQTADALMDGQTALCVSLCCPATQPVETLTVLPYRELHSMESLCIHCHLTCRHFFHSRWHIALYGVALYMLIFILMSYILLCFYLHVNK